LAIFRFLAGLYRPCGECCVGPLLGGRAPLARCHKLSFQMTARLKPLIVRTYRQQQETRQLDYWQKLIDEQTAKEFERYTARLKRTQGRRVA
jgi:hypothetical protein